MTLTAALRAATPLIAALVLASCGDSSDADGTERENVSPAVALREVGETRDALSAALETYKSGDHAAAADQAAEAYVQHFEEVEGPLGKRDEELNEELEEAISQDVRNAMKAGKPVADVERAIDAILADLEKAEAVLR